MFNIRALLNNYYYKTLNLFLFSISLIILGVYLIINSVINISILEFNFKNQKITNLKSEFKIREDISIKDLNLKDIHYENNHSDNESMSLTGFDLQTVTSSGTIPFFELKKLPNELNMVMDVKTKKEKFILSILPSVAQENEKIRSNRKKLLIIKKSLLISKTLNKKDQQFINNIALEYNLDTLNKHKIDIILTLLDLVDEIPNSIVIAQAANESGWGTSRFAKEFNALFGEYTFDIKNGIIPIYRSNEDKYLIKYFTTINESVESYFNNLNTHSAYNGFREARKKLRKNNLELDPLHLVGYLKFYAKDKNYVKTIKSIIKTNKLIQFDKIKIITTKS